jgi:tetratricopeptide (TPR) repeat protein
MRAEETVSKLSPSSKIRRCGAERIALRCRAAEQKEQDETQSIERRIREAVARYSEILRVAPKNMFARYMRAAHYADLGEYEKARFDVEELVRLEPENTTYLAERAAVYAELGLKQMATADCQRVLANDPKNVQALGTRGRLHQLDRNWRLALTDYDAVMALRPTYYTILHERARIEEELGQLDKALADLSTISKTLDVSTDIARVQQAIERLAKSRLRTKSPRSIRRA